MAKRHRFGNQVAPLRFNLLLVLLIGTAFPATWLGTFALGVTAAFDAAAMFFPIVCWMLLMVDDPGDDSSGLSENECQSERCIQCQRAWFMISLLASGGG